MKLKLDRKQVEARINDIHLIQLFPKSIYQARFNFQIQNIYSVIKLTLLKFTYILIALYKSFLSKLYLNIFHTHSCIKRN